MDQIPSLHEIAAMPFPASMKAMRKHYNPDWGKPIPDGAEKQTYVVEVQFSYSNTDTHTVEVEAFSSEEAEELASDEVEKYAENEYGPCADIEIMNAVARVTGGEA